MNGLAGEDGRLRAQQARGSGIGKADVTAAIDAADAVGDGIKKNLLAARELFGAALFLRARQHLAQRSGNGLNGRQRFAILAEQEVGIELENGEDPVAYANRNGPAGNHLVAQCRFDAGAGGHGSQFRNPDRTAILPRAPGEVGSACKGEAHAFLNQSFCATSRGSPRGTEFKPLFFRIDAPFHGQIPALRYAQSFKNAHGRDFGGSVLSDNLADDQLQRKTVFPLPLLGYIAQQATNGEGISRLLALAEAHLQLENAAIGRVMPKRLAVDYVAIQGAPEQRRHFAAGVCRKELFK